MIFTAPRIRRRDVGGEADLRPVGLVLPEAEDLSRRLVEVVVAGIRDAHGVRDAHHLQERTGIRRVQSLRDDDPRDA